jgi:hypothetical protein
MKKFSLINIDFDFQDGDEIIFEMPAFCSGDYAARVYKDENYGCYIDDSSNWFEGCRSFYVRRNNEIINPS